jgi:hypothetical protein
MHPPNFVNKAAVGTHQARQQNVADAIIDSVVMWHPAFLDDNALHADLSSSCCDHARVVRLHAAN